MGLAQSSAPADLDLAFYYGPHVPFRELGHFEYVVVQADDVSPETLDGLRARTRPVAYVSIGEAEPGYEIEPEWVLTHNSDWDTSVMDLTAAGWRELVLQRLDTLTSRGFNAFFLDTLDSYHLLEGPEESVQAQSDALAALIREIHRRWPEAELILNRGFEVLPEVHGAVTAVAAESMFSGWDNSGQRFVPVADEARDWLTAQLRTAQQELGLPVVVIDYAPEDERGSAREIAGRIAELGFTPFVSVPSLDMMGVGRLEVIPRRVLALYDSEGWSASRSPAHRLAAPILDYLGYAVDYHDIRGPLSEYPLTGRYAGVVSWLDEAPGGSVIRTVEDWLERRVLGKVPLVLLGSSPVASDDLLARMGVSVQTARPGAELTVSALTEAARTGEGVLRPRRLEVAPWRNDSPENDVLFGFRDEHGASWDPVLVGPWGGAALDPYVLEPLVGDRRRWLIDPFAFFESALGGPAFPRPDPTTENGRRIMTAHVDGDGFVSRAEWPDGPYAAEVVRDRILNRYRIPTTVSVIEGEIGPTGLYPDQSAELEALAREIFELPHVEAADRKSVV